MRESLQRAGVWALVVALVVALVPSPAASAAPVAPAAPVTPAAAAAPGSYVPLPSPVRVLDTREGRGAAGPLRDWSTVPISLSPVGVPSSASAVVVNVTAVTPTDAGVVTVYPYNPGSPMPVVSNLNFTAGDVIPNLVTVQLGRNASVAFTVTTAGTVHLVADVAGYYVGGTVTSNGAFVATTPSRVLDTRETLAVGPGQTTVVKVAGQAGVPGSGAGSVFVNATVTGTSAPGYLTLYPDGATPPTASNLNFTAGETVPNLASVKLGNGSLVVKNSSSAPVDVVIDVFGYVLANSSASALGAFVPLTPQRKVDTRQSTWGPALYAYERMGMMFEPGVTGIVANVTVTEPQAPGYLTAYPAAADASCTRAPTASNLNFTAGETVPNLVVVATGGSPTAPRTCFLNGSPGSTHFLLDLAGVFVDPSQFRSTVTTNDVRSSGVVTGVERRA